MSGQVVLWSSELHLSPQLCDQSDEGGSARLREFQYAVGRGEGSRALAGPTTRSAAFRSKIVDGSIVGPGCGRSARRRRSDRDMPTESPISLRAEAIANGLLRTGGQVVRGRLRLRATRGGFYWIAGDGSRLPRGIELDRGGRDTGSCETPPANGGRSVPTMDARETSNGSPFARGIAKYRCWDLGLWSSGDFDRLPLGHVTSAAS
jgi:hypothetical protein